MTDSSRPMLPFALPVWVPVVTPQPELRTLLGADADAILDTHYPRPAPERENDWPPLYEGPARGWPESWLRAAASYAAEVDETLFETPCWHGTP